MEAFKSCSCCHSHLYRHCIDIKCMNLLTIMRVKVNANTDVNIVVILFLRYPKQVYPSSASHFLFYTIFTCFKNSFLNSDETLASLALELLLLPDVSIFSSDFRFTAFSNASTSMSFPSAACKIFMAIE